MKVIVSGSIAFQEDYQHLQEEFNNSGIDVIDYPRVSQNLEEVYPQIFTTFFRNIEEADLFFLFNQDKNGVSGYIGAASFSELTYCLMQNRIHGKKIKVLLLKEPSEENFCFDEVDRWLRNGWVEVGIPNCL